MNNTTTVSVTVPTDRVADLYAYIATLFTDAASSYTPEVAKVPAGDLVYEDVKEAYLGGYDNQAWKDLLLELAAHPGEEVFWPDLCDKVGFSRKVMSGVIGAGERRTKPKVPYTKRYSGEDTYFMMSPEVAEMIIRASNE
jgi:hypothetical protein